MIDFNNSSIFKLKKTDASKFESEMRDILIEDEKIIERMSGRRICSGCGASYHVVYKPTKAENICDACGASLYTRSDDAAETVLKRLETFHNITEPLKEFYQNKGMLVTVAGNGTVDETTKRTFEALGI